MTERFREQLQQAIAPAYTIDREITGGGMSRVFVATEHALGRTVVVKVLRLDLAAGVNRDRFRREIMLAAQLQHPHIVPVLSAGERGELIWYTMPFVEGESLREALARRGRFSPRDTVRVLHDVLDALAYAHQRSVIHRDIKPGNILTHGSHALVTDFGVAKALSASMPQSGATSGGIAIGTPAYMAPEQLAADPSADHRMDLYAVGLLAYELLTGEQPFSEASPAATMAAQLTRMPEPIEKVCPDVPPLLGAVIMRLLAKQPDDRPPTAAAALDELEAVITPQSGISAPTPASSPRGFGIRSLVDGTPAPEVRGARPRWLVTAIGLIAVAAVATFIIARGNRTTPSPPTAPIAVRRESALPSPPATGALPAPPRAPNDTPRVLAPKRTVAGADSGRTRSSSPAVRGGAGAQPSGASGASGAQSSGGFRAQPPGGATPATTLSTRSAAASSKSGLPASAKNVPAPRSPPVALMTPTGHPKRVAILPVRDVTTRPQLATVARALEDSLKRAAAAAGYGLATDAELVRLLGDADGNAQRRTADGAGIGAIVTSFLTVNNRELQAQVLVLDVWRNTPQSQRGGSELDDTTGTLVVVRDVLRSLARVSWRQRSDPHRAVVFDFENVSGVDSLAAVSTAFTDSIRAAVQRLGAEVVGDSAARVTKDVNDRRFVGLQLVAGALVTGGLYRRGVDSVRVRLSIRDLSEERTFETFEIAAPLRDAFSALPNVLQRLAADLGRVNWGPKGMPPS
jgi:serine/threonine-protein kinase